MQIFTTNKGLPLDIMVLRSMRDLLILTSTRAQIVGCLRNDGFCVDVPQDMKDVKNKGIF